MLGCAVELATAIGLRQGRGVCLVAESAPLETLLPQRVPARPWQPEIQRQGPGPRHVGYKGCWPVADGLIYARRTWGR